MTNKNVTIDRNRLFSLFRDMVDIYSPSGKEESLSEYLTEYLEQSGFSIIKQPVDGLRYNLLASTGNDSFSGLFLGHIDTVPAFDIETSGFSQQKGLCYGLGTSDMKSGCAAMIESFIATHEAGYSIDDIMLALVVGEEETGDGTQALLKEKQFEWALVGEPTNLRPCLNHYGYIEISIVISGYRQHAAMSGYDSNAVRTMLRLLLRLEELAEKQCTDMVLNIRDLHSSESGFAVPDRCAANVDLHIPPGISAKENAEKIHAFIKRELEQSSLVGCEIEFPTLADGYEIGIDDPVAEKLQKIFFEQDMQWKPIAFKSHSDANLLKDTGCNPLILGPGTLAKAHTRDESVNFEQVVSAARLYACMLVQ